MRLPLHVAVGEVAALIRVPHSAPFAEVVVALQSCSGTDQHWRGSQVYRRRTCRPLDRTLVLAGRSGSGMARSRTHSSSEVACDLDWDH